MNIHEILSAVDGKGDRNVSSVYIDNKVYQIDVQDKQTWCQIGEYYEEKFVEMMRGWFPHIKIEINPEKIKNKYAPDLIINDKITDLKTQFAPFFKSYLYGCDPQFTFSFDKKDFVRYKEKYPEIYIMVWFQHRELKKKIYGKWYSVKYHGGIYCASFEKICRLIESSPLHSHMNRTTDNKGNAKENYLLDIQDFSLIRSLEINE